MELPKFLLSKEGRAERNKREKIAELTAQKNELLRKKAAVLERRARIEGWPGDRGEGTRNERKDDTVLMEELEQQISAVEEELRLLEAEVTGVE
jgi:hypothetical protein